MGRSGFDLLAEAVNLYLDRPIAYSIVFVILSAMIPTARIGFDLENDTYEAARMGYTGWLGRHTEDTVLLKIDVSRLIRKRHRERMNDPKKRS
jgi:predicted component of type VI protein secretion system